MQRRGRSRQVSQAAVARQASEERLQCFLKDLMAARTAPAPAQIPLSSSSPCSRDQVKQPLSTSRRSPVTSPSNSSRLSLSSALSGSHSTAIFSSSAQLLSHGPATGLSSVMSSVKVADNVDDVATSTTTASSDHLVLPLYGNPSIIDLTEPEVSLSQVHTQQMSSQIETYYQEDAEDVCTITPPFDHAYTYNYTYPPSVSASPPTSGLMTPITSESHASTSDSQFTFAFPDTPEESTPPPPLTLHDQLHIAYALDDLPLAKILLLKLTQGIHDITSPNDPRLAQVKPEDFDVAFLPAGGRLMSEEDEKALAQRQERERQRVQKEAQEEAERVRRYREGVERERREREEREKAEREERERNEREKAWEGWVENVWGGAKKEMAAVKEARQLARQRQDAERKRVDLLRSQGEERRRFLLEERRKSQASSSITISSTRPSTPRLSYANLPTTRLSTPAASQQPELLYSCMITPSTPRPPRKKRIAGHTSPISSSSEPSPSPDAATPSRDTPTITTPHFPSPLRHSSHLSSSDNEVTLCSDFSFSSQHIELDVMPQSIPIQDVLAAMRGPLFPPSSTESVKPRDKHCRTMSDELTQLQTPERRRSKTPHQTLSVSTSVSATTRRRKRDAELLVSLLVYPGDASTADRLQSRRSKGKGKATEAVVHSRRAIPSRTGSARSIASTDSLASPIGSKPSCAACSPTTSASSGALSRAGSWLSFVTSSSPSSSAVAFSPASTTITTPSTSVTSSPLKSSHRSGSVFSSWFRGVSSANQPLSSPGQVETCTCNLRTYSRASTGSFLTPVAKSDSPLPLDVLDTPDPRLARDKEGSISSSYLLHKPFSPSASDATSSSLPVSSLSRSVSRFIDIAKGFQSAYMQATMFAAVSGVPTVGKHGAAWDEEYQDRQASQRLKAQRMLASKSIHGGGSGKRGNLRPIGYRVSSVDVRILVPTAVPMGNKHASAKESLSQLNDAETVEGASDSQPAGFRAKLSIPDLFFGEGDIQYIPLSSPYTYTRANPPRTTLPNPLPFPLHFKPQLPLTGSPRRWTQQLQDENNEAWFAGRSNFSQSRTKRLASSPPRYGSSGFRSSRSSRRSLSPPSSRTAQASQPVSRPRIVANPVYLRVKALQNCTGIPLADAQLIQLHGGVVLKGGLLSCGKEKVLGMAFEEVGRSALGKRPQVYGTQRQGRLSMRMVEMPEPPRWERDDLAVRSGTGSRGGDAYAQERWEEGSVRRGRCVVRG